VEFRLWDGDLDLGAIQARVRLSLALADASGREEPLPLPQPLGRHYYSQSPADSAAALERLLSLFPRAAAAVREQVTRLWHLNAWQPPLVPGIRGWGNLLWAGIPMVGPVWAGYSEAAADYPAPVIMLVPPWTRSVLISLPRGSTSDDDDPSGDMRELGQRISALRSQLQVLGPRGGARPVVIALPPAGTDEFAQQGAWLVRPVSADGGFRVTLEDGSPRQAGWRSEHGWELISPDGARYDLELTLLDRAAVEQALGIALQAGTPLEAEQVRYLNEKRLEVLWVDADGDSNFAAVTRTVPPEEIRDRIGEAARRWDIEVPAGRQDRMNGQHLRTVLALLVERGFDAWPGATRFAAGDEPGLTQPGLVEALRRPGDHGGPYASLFSEVIAYFLDLPLQVLQRDGSPLLLPRQDTDPVTVPYTIVLHEDHYLATVRRPDSPGQGAEPAEPESGGPPSSHDDSSDGEDQPPGPRRRNVRYHGHDVPDTAPHSPHGAAEASAARRAVLPAPQRGQAESWREQIAAAAPQANRAELYLTGYPAIDLPAAEQRQMIVVLAQSVARPIVLRLPTMPSLVRSSLTVPSC
jgi:hypothetical protein